MYQLPHRKTALHLGALTAALFLSLASGARAHDDHAAVLAMDVTRSVVIVDVPPTKMIRQDGVSTTADKELTNGKPTVLACIYTSCTTVCPLTSQIMSTVQDKLGNKLDKTQLVSISIDPEYDTPPRLSAYAKKFGATPQWQYYTGTSANSIAIQKAFKAYQGDKMNHLPLIFVNGGNSKSWVRIEGFPKADLVLKELASQTVQ